MVRAMCPRYNGDPPNQIAPIRELTTTGLRVQFVVPMRTIDIPQSRNTWREAKRAAGLCLARLRRQIDSGVQVR